MSCSTIRVLRRWNRNLHYHPFLLASLPADCERALDVGCGEGSLARELRRSVPRVTAIDVDAASLDLARRQGNAGEIEYVLGDFLDFPFAPASFDFVVSLAALHHMDTVAALARMRDLVRPGGTLAVVGLARSRYPRDLPRDAVAVLFSRAHRVTKTAWESPAPTVWPPHHTYAEIHDLAERALPGARFRRHLLSRYSLVWTKPA